MHNLIIAAMVAFPLSTSQLDDVTAGKAPAVGKPATCQCGPGATVTGVKGSIYKPKVKK
jgi:hypothetical protein